MSARGELSLTSDRARFPPAHSGHINACVNYVDIE